MKNEILEYFIRENLIKNHMKDMQKAAQKGRNHLDNYWKDLSKDTDSIYYRPSYKMCVDNFDNNNLLIVINHLKNVANNEDILILKGFEDLLI